MNIKNYVIAILLFIVSISNIFGQDDPIEVNYEFNKGLGGDVTIEKSTLFVKNDSLYRSFIINCSESGDYYLSTWIMGMKILNQKEESLSKYYVKVNNNILKDLLSCNIENWHYAQYCDINNNPITIKLIKGENEISFISEAPYTPNIDFIKMSKNLDKSIISDVKNKEYMNSIKSKIEKRKNDPKWIESQLSPTSDSISNSILKSTVLPNPEGNYAHITDVDFNYTFWIYFYFYAGNKLTIKTNSSTHGYFAHVLEFFSDSYTETLTTAKKSDSNGEVTISTTIPLSGIYVLRIRSWQQTQQGLVDLSISGSVNLSINNCAVSSMGYYYPHTTSVVMNYFTADLTGNSMLFIEDNSAMPGDIIGWNNDYSGSGDYNWGYASRIKKNFQKSIKSILITAQSSYIPTGTCDIYGLCQNSTVASSFPNFDTDDAIQSAPASNNYNCASWGGGRVDLGRYFWASNYPTSQNLSSPWYSPYFWTAWDHYFGNNPTRYTGAPTYTTSGATSSNGEVAMWARYGDYTHFSVRKPANDQPHGYDWESKPGGSMRTFHEKNSLVDNSSGGYGTINLYYRRASTLLKSYTFEQSIDLGLTILEKVDLNTDERVKIDKLKNCLNETEITEFEQKMNVLIKKMNTPELIKHSNPSYLYNTKEFNEILDYCKTQDSRIWPLLFDNVFNDNSEESEISAILINEITSEYSKLIITVRLK